MSLPAPLDRLALPLVAAPMTGADRTFEDTSCRADISYWLTTMPPSGPF